MESPGSSSLKRILACPCVIFLLAGFLAINAWASAAQEVDPGSPRQNQPELVLESFFKNREVYEEAFRKAGQTGKRRVRAGIVPHHFLAKDLIAAFFTGIDPGPVKQVILVGPDHFPRHRGQPGLCFTSPLPWNTPFGPVAPEEKFIQELLGEDGCTRDDRVFLQEHAVYVPVPFIKKALPEARLVPLIVRNTGGYERLSALGRKLRRLGGEGTILIVSSDFAHGVSRDQARVLDQASLARLQDLRPENLKGITCDCRACLALLLGFLREGEKSFFPLDNRTSLDFGGPADYNLTSYITGYFPAQETPRLSLLFLGDLMFDRGVRQHAAARGNDYPFKEVKSLLKENHLVVANLEGPITDHISVSLNTGREEKNHYLFTFDPALALTLKKYHINLVNLGNNHLLDFGPEGLAQTKKYLDGAGVKYFGAPGREEPGFVIQEMAGLTLGLVNFNQSYPQGLERTLHDLTRLKKQADLAIIYCHWGTEYAREPGSRVRSLARLFIDRGADLIIGSHPHVVQEKEEYRGKMIYYSLGNFLFDQSERPETRRGLAVRVLIDPGDLQLEFQEIPLALERGQIRVKRERP